MTAQYAITTPPAVEPVTAAEAKLHARIFLDDDDSYIESLIVAAREKLESSVCRSFISRAVEARLDGFPHATRRPRTACGSFPFEPDAHAQAVTLLYPPLQSVARIEYVDADGVVQDLDPSAYVVLPGTPGRIVPAPGSSWPTTIDRPSSVTVQFLAGHGDDPADVPEAAKLILKILVAHWYDRREPIASTAVNPVPFMVESLSDSLRWGGYP